MARNRAVLKVRGVAELADAVRLYGDQVVRAAGVEAEGVVRSAAADIRRDAPFDPEPDEHPHLRETVSSSVSYTVYGFRATIRAEGRIAHLQEFGTARHAAQPFFIPNIRVARDRLEAAIARVVQRLAPRDLGTVRVRARAGTVSTPLVGIE